MLNLFLNLLLVATACGLLVVWRELRALRKEYAMYRRQTQQYLHMVTSLALNAWEL